MTILLSVLLSAAIQGDTLSVGHAALEGPHTLSPVFMTDTVNLEGKRYDATEVLKQNATLAIRPFKANTQAIRKGDPIGRPANDSLSTLSAMRFTIDAARWTKCSLNAKKMKQRAVYLDGRAVNIEGKEATDEMRLLPGRHEITVLDYVAAKAEPDTFDIQITGNDLSHLVVNPTAPRSFDLDLNSHGPQYGGVSLSPSGRYAVTHYANSLRGGESVWHTTLTDLHSGRNIYAGDYRNFRWCQQRDAVYYTRKGGNGLELIVLDVATMTEKTLATALPDAGFRLSPDETFVIISRTEDGPKPKNALKSLYAPDDRMDGWRNRSNPFILKFSDGVMQRLTYGSESSYVLDISHDSSRILLGNSHTDVSRQPMGRMDILEYDVATGQTTVLLKDAEWIQSVNYAADNRTLLVRGTGAAFNGIGSEVSPGQHPMSFHNTLFSYDPASGTARHLLPRGFKPSVDRIFVNTADGLLYLLCEDGYDRTLWALNPTTLQRKRYDLPLSYLNDAAIAHTASPSCIFYGQSGTQSVGAYSTVLSAKLKPYTDRTTYGNAIVRGDTISCEEQAVRPECKTFGNLKWDELYPQLRVPSCNEWKFLSTRGDEIKGFYFLPAEFDETKHYPMIVYYYGGCSPTSRVQRWHYPLAAMANMGYVVLVLEPSGASGFGQEFAARHVGTWGDESGDDIIEGVERFCQEKSFVDATKIGCMGASYGGFMTEHLLTRTDLFAAAISHAGISNIASYWGGGYWGYSYGETAEYGQFPWNNPKLFTEHSALFNADKIHTPLLLLHGTKDTNVPTNESQQLFTALKILGREVSYIQVDGENHIISDYQKRQDWIEAICAWFARHLQCDSAWWEDLGY